MSRIDPRPPAANMQSTRDQRGGMLDGPFTTNLVLGQMASQITQEMMDFASRRMRAQLQFVSSLPVGDMKGMMEAQFRFFEEASRDYAKEFTHVTDVLRQASTPPKG